MADYTVTAANVDAPAATNYSTLLAGEAITAGAALYKKAADGKAWLAVNSSDAAADFIGIALCDAAAGQVVAYLATGSITFGSIFTAAGAIVAISNTAGKICPIADISASGERQRIIGVTTDASTLKLKYWNTAVTF